MATIAPPPAGSEPEGPEAPLRATLELARPAAGRLTLARCSGPAPSGPVSG